MDDFIDMALMLIALLGIGLIVGGVYISGSAITIISAICYIFRGEKKNGKNEKGKKG